MVDVISRICEELCLNLLRLLHRPVRRVCAVATVWTYVSSVGTMWTCVHTVGTVWTYVCTVTTVRTDFAGSLINYPDTYGLICHQAAK